MKQFFLSLFAAFLILALPMHDAEAKRFGGSKSSGMQRQTATPQQATPPSNAVSPGKATPAAQTPGKRSWLGPIAGLAAGLGLAALASHLGFGEEMANIMLIMLLVLGAFMLFKFLTRKRSQPATPYGMQYAGAGNTGNITPFQTSNEFAGSSASPVAAAAPAYPADFDADNFLRQAKLHFIRMQAAYDEANLDDIRDFTTPEMYAEVKMQIAERGNTENRTDVVNLNAEMVDYAEEAKQHIASVRFYGLIREEKDAPAADFNEIWHLSKPANGKHGWIVAGIQQVD